MDMICHCYQNYGKLNIFLAFLDFSKHRESLFTVLAESLKKTVKEFIFSNTVSLNPTDLIKNQLFPSYFPRI